MRTQFLKSVLPLQISAAFIILAAAVVQHCILSLPVRASIAPAPPFVIATTPEKNYSSPPYTAEPPPSPPALEQKWRDTCVNHRVEITGIGMGDAVSSINPQHLELNNPDQNSWLLAQVAGRYGSTRQIPERVILSSATKDSITLLDPTRDSNYAYTFEANLPSTEQITAWINIAGDRFKTPRGLIAYAKRNTGLQTWTSIGRTANEYVYQNHGNGSHTEVMTFSEALPAPRDLYITAAIIDNQADDRPLVLEATAGEVTVSQSLTEPTEGTLLNIVSFTLPEVSTGTDRVSTTLRSPAEDGDSLVLVGVNVSYRCEEDDGGGNKWLYLPIVFKDYCSPFIDGFSSNSSNWPVVSNNDLQTEYINDEYRMVTKSKGLHYAINQSFTQYYQAYEIEVDAHWADNQSTGKGYGIFFGMAGDKSQTYLLQVNSDQRQYRLLLLLNGSWLYYGENEWRKPTNLEKGWVFSNSIFGGSSTNRLKVSRSSSEIRLFVNDQHLDTVTDDTINSGQVGLSVERYDDSPEYGTQNADVRFDNYRFDLCMITGGASPVSNASISSESTGTLPSTN